MKLPKIMRPHDGTGVIYASAYKICQFYAEEAEWNGNDATYWKAEADYYKKCLDMGINGYVMHPTIERQLEKDAELWKNSWTPYQPQHCL